MEGLEPILHWIESQSVCSIYLFTCDFCYGEAETNGGVGEGHDGGNNGEPPDLVEVGELREQDLDGSKYNHVGGVGCLAGRIVAIAVEAIRPSDRPTCMHRLD